MSGIEKKTTETNEKILIGHVVIKVVPEIKAVMVVVDPKDPLVDDTRLQ